MNSTKFIIVITKREYSEKFINFQKEHGVNMIFSSLCRGTATKSTLDYLGIEDTDKALLLSVAKSSITDEIIRDSLNKLRIDIPGNGIVCTIPIDCIGGSSALNYLLGNQILDMNKETDMNEFKYTMIIAIAEKGHTDMVMDAAKSVGARGGTVVHAKGTGHEEQSKFFGMSIAAEKELVFIVAKQKDRDQIIKAIMTMAGLNTKAKAVVFSLPVDNVAGLRSVTDEE